MEKQMKTLPKCDMTVSQKEELTVQLKHAQRTAMADTANALDSIIQQQKLTIAADAPNTSECSNYLL